MMSKTHLAVGVASSLAVTMPDSVGGLFKAVIGGCVGGVLCDVECRSTPGMRDALYGRIIAAGVTVLLLAMDRIINSGIWVRILSQSKSSIILGLVILFATCLVGRLSDHRTFTHSLLYVLLITFGSFCIDPEFLIPVLAGGLSHLTIDTLNKKPVPWLYPLRKKGICFNICFASKTGNAVCMWLGLIASIALIGWRLTAIIASV